MTGVPTQLTVADLVLGSLRSGGGPVPDDADLPFFRLGALGPVLGDYLPTHPAAAAGPNAPMFGVWAPILRLLAGTVGTPGMAANLRRLKDVLGRFEKAVQDKDQLALLAMKDDLQALPGVVSALQGQFGSISGLRTSLKDAILKTRPLPKAPPAGKWVPRDTVHGHRTGTFWHALRTKAAASGDPRIRAFGLGSTVGYAGALCGNPFVNGVVGSPYRTHWWRHRWVSHHVDAWVWGYYRTRERVRAAGAEIVFPAGTGGRVPLPPCGTWDDIAGAELQDRFAIGGITPDLVLNAVRDGVPLTGFLPPELVTLWLDSYRDAVGDPASAGVDGPGLDGAYAMTWLTTWVMSSAALLGATPPHRIQEPDACGDRPDWVEVDGSVVVGGTVVPPPTVTQPDPSVAEVASAIVAAILGVAEFLLGGLAAAAALLWAAVELLDDATDPGWDNLRCQSGWTESFLARLENAFHDLLSTSGLGPPYAVQLAHNEIQFQTWGTIVPPDSGLGTCRSPSAQEGDGYPAGLWSPAAGSESNWPQYPTEPLEAPMQMSYPEGPWWPLHFVDGFSFTDAGPGAVPRFPATQDNPLAAPVGTPTVLDPAAWEQRMHSAETGGRPQGAFGNAVDVAVALIGAPTMPLLDWDLDGDRGIGWPTWVFQDPAGHPGPVVRE
ncbi:hypothetical protein [Kitasatospora sp. NPDC094015]|uniref:hypothetical protein n=1 Tax=Kitasatospora sp. NPDC094015 TaxID=3155205 RepID=UPI0033197CFB